MLDKWFVKLTLTMAALLFSAVSAHAADSRIVTVAIPNTAAAYAAGDVVGGKIELENIVCGTPNTTGFITGATLADADDLNSAFKLVFFDTDPATIADNAAFNPSNSDNENIVAVVALDASDDRHSWASNGIHTTGSITVPVRGAGDGTLWAYLVIGSGLTMSTADGLSATIAVACD